LISSPWERTTRPAVKKMTAISSVGSSRTVGRREVAGFTLIELLVVLAIGVVALATVSVQVGSSLEGSRFRSSVRALATALKQAHSAAVMTQDEVVLQVDTEARTFELTEGRSHALEPATMEIEMTVAEQEVDGSRAGIRFYGDGSATGGRIALRLAQREAVIDVDWLTGLVEIQP
jgi:general secretion pathway protein H